MLIRNGEPYSLPPITQEEDTVNGFLSKSAVDELIETVGDLPSV